jgi:hypothetical protein
MQHLLLVNPKRRRNAGRKRHRKMSALQRKYFGKRGHGRTINPRRKRRSNPARSHRRRRNPVRALAMNPRRHRRRHNPVRHHRRRRNPALFGGGGFVMPAVMGAVTGTVGALATDIVWNFIPLPVNLKSGPMGTLAKAAGTIALGMGASMLIGKKWAHKATEGALTVQLYNFAKPMLAGMGVPGLGYYGAGYALNEYLSDSTPNSLLDGGMGAFVPNSLLGDVDIDEAEVIDSSTYPMRFVGEYLSEY